jgi:hypothetical protein
VLKHAENTYLCAIAEQKRANLRKPNYSLSRKFTMTVNVFLFGQTKAKARNFSDGFSAAANSRKANPKISRIHYGALGT